jgi:hypothetical protein
MFISEIDLSPHSLSVMSHLNIEYLFAETSQALIRSLVDTFAGSSFILLCISA